MGGFFSCFGDEVLFSVKYLLFLALYSWLFKSVKARLLIKYSATSTMPCGLGLFSEAIFKLEV